MSSSSTGKHVLIVEDERAQREALTRYLEKRGFNVHSVESGEEAMHALEAGNYAVLLTDQRLPGVDGLEVIRHARKLDEDLVVLLCTAYASVDSAVEALRAGADDYLLKPLILEEVGRKVGSLIEQRALSRENMGLKQALKATQSHRDLVTKSSAMQQVIEWVERAAENAATVLITGETGTGKEVVARRIHDLGKRAAEPFLPVNLAALPENMVESELFGHEKGAFTGADRRRDGILRAAGDGTVFLDEIAELPIGVQAKLLRAIEAREVRPVGRDRAVPFTARILAATHRDLVAMQDEGSFRQDLYYRLNVVHIQIPPLRERPEDIPKLSAELVARHSAHAGREAPDVSMDALRCLCAHPWRGNVRELSNVLERALILAGEETIEIEHLPRDVGEGGASMRLNDAVERFERTHIAAVLRLCDGNREQAATELGVSPATLYRRLERLQLKGADSQD